MNKDKIVEFMKKEKNRKKLYKWLGILVILGSLILANKYFFDITPKKLDHWIKSSPIPAPILYISLFGIRSFLFLPITLFIITGGLLFPWFTAVLYTLAGITLSAVLSLFVLRLIGDSINPSKQENLSALINEMEKNSFRTVLFIRLLPGINYDLMTYFCAKTKVNWWKYGAASLIGAIPTTLLYISIGNNIFSLGVKGFLLIGLFLAFVLVIGWYMKRKVSEKMDFSKMKDELNDLVT